MTRNEQTIATILQDLSTVYDGIMAERIVFDAVLERRPSQAKDPYSSIRNQLRFGAARIGWVWLGDGFLAPLHSVLKGLRFRLIPTAEELASGQILRGRFRPFILSNISDLSFVDSSGAAIPVQYGSTTVDYGLFGAIPQPTILLTEWFKRTAFQEGDSLLITLRDGATLVLEREPVAQLQATQVQEQDRELLNDLVARVRRGGRQMIAAEDAILAIYARAAWRAAYPGSPWQQLVMQDTRLRLLDEDYIADQSFRRPLDLLTHHPSSEQAQLDAALLDRIFTLQNELLASRQHDAARGVWNGLLPRTSTSRVIYDMRDGTTETIYPGAVNALQDHTATIESHIENNDYADEWELDDEAGDDLEDIELSQLTEIEDLQEFIERNPEIGEATRRLVESLSPEEIEQLQNARNLEDAQQVLAGRLTDLLRREPSLFVPLEPPLLGASLNNGHVNDNGTNGTGALNHADYGYVNGQNLGDVFRASSLWDDDEEPTSSWDDEDEDDEEEGDELFGEESHPAIEQALERSTTLLERFFQSQMDAGKSETTAANRTRDLWVYADFLGHYYQRSLEAGDYATLDECLFFFYPRRVMNSSARAAREMCTSLKQFYAFLKQQQDIAEDTFAQAIWRRRDQVASVIQLYEELDSDSPEFERLFAHLFSPYTA